jgi:hypothetical protein
LSHFASCMHGSRPDFGQVDTSWTSDSNFPRSTAATVASAKFSTVRASDGLQHAAPYWHGYFGSISAELESILEGHFTVTKNGLPVLPIFQQHHPSWEDNEEAQRVLILVLSEWFTAGSWEYVERIHLLPHCILAISVLDSTNF